MFDKKRVLTGRIKRTEEPLTVDSESPEVSLQRGGSTGVPENKHKD